MKRFLSAALEAAQKKFKSFAVRLSKRSEEFIAQDKNEVAACSVRKFNLFATLINNDFKQSYYAAAERTDRFAAIFL